MFYTKIPNRTKETGIYDTGVVTLDNTTELDNCLLFSDAFGENSYESLTVLIESLSNPDMWAIYGASYDSDLHTLTCVDTTATVNKGVLSSPSAVKVSAVFSFQALNNLQRQISSVGYTISYGGSDLVLLEKDVGKTIICDSTDPMNVYLPELPLSYETGFIDIVSIGTGDVSILPNAGNTINGSASALVLATQYTKAHLFSFDDGTYTNWVGIV